MDQTLHYNVVEHLDQIKEIVEKVYSICGTVNKEYIDDLINNYDEIFAICNHENILKSIAILENNKDTLIIKLVCSKSKGGTNIVEKCENIARSRSYKYVKLESIPTAYGFYRKLGFLSSTSTDLDDIWDKFNDPFKTNKPYKICKKTINVGKRISRHNKNRAKTLLDRIPLENKVQICIDLFGGDPKRMFSDVSCMIPSNVINMKKSIKI